MKNTLKLNCKALMVVLIFIMMLFAVSADAASQYVPGLRIGTGNLLITNGTVTVKDSNAATKVTIAPSTGNITTSGTITAGGAVTAPYMPIVNETGASRTIASTDFGKIIACSYAGATTITLPDPSSGIVGATLFITELVDQTLTIVGGSTANNNQIIADGVLTSDSVAFSTSSHKIGAMCRVTCISATKWLITNASGCAMTPEAAD